MIQFDEHIFACGRETVRAFYNFLNLHTCSMLRNIWAWCNNIFELEHMSMLRNIWACTHVRCYATSGLAHMVVATQHHGLGWGGGWGGVGMMMFFGLAHMLDATELLMFFRACTHVGCYETDDVL